MEVMFTVLPPFKLKQLTSSIIQANITINKESIKKRIFRMNYEQLNQHKKSKEEMKKKNKKLLHRKFHQETAGNTGRN